MSRARAILNGLNNRVYVEDAAAHEWYRFVLSYPPHLVRDYVQRFDLGEDKRVLDPFCGTGTTVVECKKLGIPSVGIEANAMAHFASEVKVDWSPDPDGLIEHASWIASTALERLVTEGIPDSDDAGKAPLFIERSATGGHEVSYRTLPPDAFKLLLTDSISQRPLHKALVLLEVIREHGDGRYLKHELLALAKALAFSVSNLHFGPEVGVSRIKKLDAPVVPTWPANVSAMANDLRELRTHGDASAVVYHSDARQSNKMIEPCSVDAVITSPPYPNEKDYTRTPTQMKAETKIPDATPGLVAMYSLDDEQALLAKLRYNRLIDIFSGITCYSLQNHLRTFISGIGQVETDEIYVGVDKKGRHYIFPVQAKGHSDKLNVVQIEQDFALCASKFPDLICRPIGAQFMGKNLIALFEFESTPEGVKLAEEEHYRLVAADEVTPEVLRAYQERLPNS